MSEDGRLAARHVGLAYVTCLRGKGDAASVEDAALVVFLPLARKAPAAGPVESAVWDLLGSAVNDGPGRARREGTRDRPAGIAVWRRRNHQQHADHNSLHTTSL